MSDNNSNKHKALNRIHGVHNLWGDWAVAFGAITAVDLLSYLIPKMIFPAFVLIIAWLMGVYSSSSLHKNGLTCVRIPALATRTILLTALVQVILVAVYRIDGNFRIFQPETVNHSIPYITALIIYPVGFFTMLVGHLRHGKTTYCRICPVSNSFTPESEFVNRRFLELSRKQIRLMMYICLALSVVTWSYYFIFYINVNFNSPDKFFFFIVPVIGYVTSLIYLLARYNSFIGEIKNFYLSGPSEASSTTIRYIILRGDEMLLDEMPDKSLTGLHLFDTPAHLAVSFRESVTEEFADSEFEKISNAYRFFLRPLYSNVAFDGNSNMFHYAVILPEDSPLPEGWTFGNNWVTLPVIDRMLKAGLIAPPLMSEINRIFTITMAWKTYDREGRRLYPIKNYHPTFRLRDLKDWDVDYNDLSWIRIADRNEDRPFFRIRNIMRKFSNNLC